MQGLREHFPEDWIDFVDCGFLSLRLPVKDARRQADCV